MDNERYDVVIVDTKTKKIESVIGTNMTYDRAERRVETGAMRTNIGPYFVTKIPHEKGRKAGDPYPDNE